MKKGTDRMKDDAPGGAKDGGGFFPPESPACAEARRQIVMGVFHEEGASPASAAAHVASCPSCRAWEAEVRGMHGLCRGACDSDPASLTEKALRSAAAPAPPARPAAGVPRMGSLFAAVAVSIVLANFVVAAFLRDDPRAFYLPLLGALMLVVTAWVFVDSRGRDLRRGFWTAIQPFTLPAGLVAYLLCRERRDLRCPECGVRVSSRDLFCASCGRKLQELCCHCSRPVKPQFHVCPWCGTPLSACRLDDEEMLPACAWSRGQIAFVLAGNAALLAALFAALFGFGSPASAAAGALYFLGIVPLFDWTAFDSRRRAMDTVGWGLLVIVAGYAGFVIYLACRSELVVECPVCGGFPPASFNYCPCCGSLIGPACAKCGTAAGEGDYCTVCGAKRA